MDVKNLIIGILSAALIGCVAAIFVYQHKLTDTRQNLSATEEKITQMQKFAVHQANLQAQAAKTATAAASVAAKPTAQNSYYPPLVAQAPAPKAPTVEDVYNPEKNARGNEAAMDGIKKRYEEILVTYLFLKNCGKAGANDYAIIMASLTRAMAGVNAPNTLQADIVNAAQGSYKEMYAATNCNTPEAGTLVAQYNSYIKTLATPAQAH